MGVAMRLVGTVGLVVEWVTPARIARVDLKGRTKHMTTTHTPETEDEKSARYGRVVRALLGEIVADHLAEQMQGAEDEET